MLNKEICLKCYTKKNHEENFEFDWKNGHVLCLYEEEVINLVYNNGQLISIKDKIPNWCPYKLEHVLSNNI